MYQMYQYGLASRQSKIKNVRLECSSKTIIMPVMVMRAFNAGF